MAIQPGKEIRMNHPNINYKIRAIEICDMDKFDFPNPFTNSNGPDWILDISNIHFQGCIAVEFIPCTIAIQPEKGIKMNHSYVNYRIRTIKICDRMGTILTFLVHSHIPTSLIRYLTCGDSF